MKWYRPKFDYTKWHKIFCFLPQRIGDYIVWFHWVEAQRFDASGNMYLRLIKKEENEK